MDSKMNNKVIVSPHYNRPAYTKRVLEALSKCRGIEDYLLFMSAEPGNEEVIDLLHTVDFCYTWINVNMKRMGCSPHIHQVLEDGFKKSNYVIIVEDDIVLCEDALEYFEWASTFEDHQGIFTVSAWDRAKPPVPAFQCRKVKEFVPWGWATWKSRWTEMSSRWNFNDWDVHLNTQVRGNRSAIVPFTSRSENIGAEGGINVPSPEWHAQYQTTWATSHGFSPGDFSLVWSR